MYGQITTTVTVLEKLGEAVFPGSAKFIATEKFTEPKFWLSNNFKVWMLPKVEDGVKPSTLAYGRLVQANKDAVILASLGGEEKAETSLTEMFQLLELQENGEEGVLLIDGRANIFYILDVTGVLRAVYARWSGGQWELLADLTSDPYDWRAENRVFSRN